MTKWIESTGGPLVFGPHDYVVRWLGVLGNSGFDAETDYDAACACGGSISLLRGEKYWICVLGDEPDRTTVWRLSSKEFLIVRWRYAIREEDVLGELDDLEENDIETYSSWEIDIPSGKCTLIDAAFDPHSITDSIDIEMIGGRYTVTTQLAEPNYDTSFLVHRFKLFNS